MKFQINAVALGLLVSTTAYAQISWSLQQGLFAQSNALVKGSQGQSILFREFNGSNNGIAQFPYTTMARSSRSVPLVSVILSETLTKKDFILQQNFDTVSQPCKCYFLDARELFTRFPELSDSLQYRISFRSGDGKVQAGSGFFGIVMKGTVVPQGLKLPTVLPSDSASGANLTAAAISVSKITTVARTTKKAASGASSSIVTGSSAVAGALTALLMLL